jgi:hypothetical protein
MRSSSFRRSRPLFRYLRSTPSFNWYPQLVVSYSGLANSTSPERSEDSVRRTVRGRTVAKDAAIRGRRRGNNTQEQCRREFRFCAADNPSDGKHTLVTGHHGHGQARRPATSCLRFDSLCFEIFDTTEERRY